MKPISVLNHSFIFVTVIADLVQVMNHMNINSISSMVCYEKQQFLLSTLLPNSLGFSSEYLARLSFIATF